MKRKVVQKKIDENVSRKTLVIIDPQNDFIIGHMGGEIQKSIADKITESVKNNYKNYREIVITLDTHPNRESAHFIRFGRHCVAKTNGWKVYQPLASILSDVAKDGIKVRYLQKETFQTRIRLLPEIIFVDMMGFCTDLCVLANAIRLNDDNPEVDVFIRSDYCAGTSEENHKKALEILNNFGINVVRDLL